jgi:exodeoxyribonuclease V beta subunit
MIFRQPDYVYEDLRFGRTLDTAKGRYDTLGTIKALALDEVAGEQTRLMYVALTRAKHHCALWWANGQDAHRTALAKVLFARNTDNGAIDPALFEHDGVSVPTDSECVDLLERVFRGGTGASCQITDINSTLASWKGEVKQEEAPLHVALLNRPLVRLQHRWSFSAMIPNQEYVANPDDDALGDAGAFDETLRELSATVPLGAIGAATDLPLGAMPAGAAFGTCVHEIFEHLDFADTALESSLHQIVEEAVRWHGIPADSYELVAGLTKVIESPLGFPLDNRPLRSFGRVDRLDELRFELRLGDGVEHSAPPTNRDIGRLVMHYIEADHPIYGWAERLANEQHVLNLTGHLTGSIDLVLRLRSDEKEPKDRFFIADYKTNSLAPRGRLPLLDDYHPDKLPAAMEEHEYPLQALLYSVVLHRYLRWKLDDYDPECHLGGIAYLFVRGMAGSSTPIVDGNPYGVFNWKLPVGLIEELSSLLHGKVGAR